VDIVRKECVRQWCIVRRRGGVGSDRKTRKLLDGRKERRGYSHL
jgi:hypothetical protein